MKVMKYIDSEKLKAEIERLIKVNKELTPRDFTQGIAAGYADVLSSIESQEQEQPTIKGWVARNRKGVSPSLVFFYEKPVRKDNGWGNEFWHASRTWSEHISVSPKLFPDLKCEDEPIEVELIIKKV